MFVLFIGWIVLGRVLLWLIVCGGGTCLLFLVDSPLGV